MVKKLFFLLLFGCPLVLSAHAPLFMTAPIQISKASPKACCKEYFTREERELVDKLWSLIKNRKFDTVKKMMTQDFRGLGLDGQIVNRTYALNALKNTYIIEYIIQDLVLTRTEDSLSAMYTLFLKVPIYNGMLVPMVEMSTFQKVDGRWKWKADANFNEYNVES